MVKMKMTKWSNRQRDGFELFYHTGVALSVQHDRSTELLRIPGHAEVTVRVAPTYRFRPAKVLAMSFAPATLATRQNRRPKSPLPFNWVRMACLAHHRSSRRATSRRSRS